ncbi:GNAT family N-acetyltransferase [Pediococcus ethanolidurans]|uniref:GNAT family N-acetyltransferase n=1 Tax=Pediococcus ethanolidurans TaxID=319653 RepID=UPI001C1F076D|nr:GNAT family N-acetyltransferase [Pediococcus ethanolidurans]MBU7555230.1 GNAT family N-acetyltransferase [Pediococcus ethanolidurans]MCV3324466.1 GNAT family N-acetyltransferase [Pediococcus ethanolidurans]MCV3556015.1 GNAT family N-acetyltransferase [Pediococcus ethanolidurans]
MTIEEKLLLNNHLETQRLLLRPVTVEDVEDMYEYASDPETVKYIYARHKNLDDTRTQILNYFVKDPEGKWGIELKSSHKLIGSIDFRLDAKDLKAEIGYAIGRNYWGNGFAPEAAKRLLKMGFNDLGLKRIDALHCSENLKSGRVMQKIGMQKEGLLKNNTQLKGRTVDDILYAITDDQWQTQQ